MSKNDYVPFMWSNSPTENVVLPMSKWTLWCVPNSQDYVVTLQETRHVRH